MWSKGGPSYPNGSLVYNVPVYSCGKGGPALQRPKEEHTENQPPQGKQEDELKVQKDRTRTLAERYTKPDHEAAFFIGRAPSTCG